MERAAQGVADHVSEGQMGAHVGTVRGHRMDPPALPSAPDGERVAGEIPAQDPAARQFTGAADAVPRLEAIGEAPGDGGFRGQGLSLASWGSL